MKIHDNWYIYMYALGQGGESHTKIRSLWPWPLTWRSKFFIFYLYLVHII